MDLKSLKQKALELKDKAMEITNKTIETSVSKLAETSIVLKTELELNDFVLKSENKVYTSPEWDTKIYEKRVFVIFWDAKSKFFKELLYILPVLLTKSFSQNTHIKVVDTNNEEINHKRYNFEEIPTMIVFQNKEVYKLISWEENIKKVVKSFTLDINKTIDEL